MSVPVDPGPQQPSAEDYRAALDRLNRFAVVTDSCFRIPLTQIRFGLSPLIGLLPVIGDVAGLILSFYVIAEARRMKAPRLLRWRMIFNAVMEAILGIVPFVGDAFDVWFKANTRNLDLLCRHLRVQLEPPPKRRDWPWMLLAALFIVAAIVLLVLGQQTAGTA